ncbi:NleF caspase inhibitor [Sodalis praecaptivus]|nr:NleF caspase inhibitor [Sodalis praecaptivus]
MNPFYVGTVANYNASSLAQAAAQRDRASAVCSPAQIKKIEEANAIPGLYNIDELAPGLITALDTLSRGLFDLDAEISRLYKKVYTSCYNAARQDEESRKVDKQKLADRFSRFKGLLNFAVDLFNECHYFHIKKLSMRNFITSKMSNEDYKKIQSHSTFINTYHVDKLWPPHGITVDKDKDVQEAIEKFHPMREAARLVEQHFNTLRNTYIMLEENALSLYRETFALDIVDPQGNHIPLSPGKSAVDIETYVEALLKLYYFNNITSKIVEENNFIDRFMFEHRYRLTVHFKHLLSSDLEALKNNKSIPAFEKSAYSVIDG